MSSMKRKLYAAIGFTIGFLLVVHPTDIINAINVTKSMDIMDVIGILSKFINL